ncbi:MAG TPA: 2OG-Fe(II) oxygenase [Xanthomonadaceae bacterium]|jgi:prolyl 4-hydroxylase|nr:2OG-Fe(II) oxygenase [Xanthomonadaceae bacterium]
MNAAMPSASDALPVRDLARYVQCFDHALDPAFCAQMIESFEKLSRLHDRNGRGVITSLTDSSWTELNVSKLADAGMLDLFRGQVFRFLEQYNALLGLTLPIPARERLENLRIKRYFVESHDQFQPHFDALDYTSNRYLVFLWYLNDVAEGGETDFPDLGLRVGARAGRLLVFPPYWMFQHAGLPPKSNDKYIISTYLLF